MMQLHLPFSVRTAERLMAIARNPVLTKSDNLSLLPPSSGTLYLLSQVDVDRLEAKLADGTITSRLEAADVKRKVLEHEPAEPTTAEPDPPVGVKNAARIEAETREPESKPEPDPLPVPGAEAERPAAPATDTVPAAPTEMADDETEPDEEDLEPTAEETLTNAIESIGLLLDTLFDEEIIYELAEVDLDKRDAFFSRLPAEFNKRMDAIKRMPVLDKADAIDALPELVKAYFRMHGRLSNCDVRWYMNRFPALNRNKLKDSERRAIADKLIRDMLQCGELIKVKCKRDVYEIATKTAPSAVEVDPSIEDHFVGS
jgi:hypothetical protein